jgi:hypothetical protein
MANVSTGNGIQVNELPIIELFVAMADVLKKKPALQIIHLKSRFL